MCSGIIVIELFTLVFLTSDRNREVVKLVNVMRLFSSSEFASISSFFFLCQ